MNYILESILVGIYEVILYLIFSLFIKNLYILLLVVGFLKHFLSYFIGIQSWYCNNGQACLNSLDPNQRYVASTLHLLRSSVGEAFAHLFLGFLLSNFLSRIYLFFTIGVILHIIAENMGIHKQFCKESCQEKATN
jgi:hypothetical protein